MVGCPKSLPLVEVGCLQLGITIREESLLSSRFPTISILKKPETRGYFRLFRNLSSSLLQSDQFHGPWYLFIAHEPSPDISRAQVLRAQ